MLFVLSTVHAVHTVHTFVHHTTSSPRWGVVFTCKACQPIMHFQHTMVLEKRCSQKQLFSKLTQTDVPTSFSRILCTTICIYLYMICCLLCNTILLIDRQYCSAADAGTPFFPLLQSHFLWCRRSLKSFQGRAYRGSNTYIWPSRTLPTLPPCLLNTWVGKTEKRSLSCGNSDKQ